MSLLTTYLPRCTVCVDAPAELVNSEHGDVCGECHQALQDADELLGTISMPIEAIHELPEPTTKPTTHEL